MPKEIHEIFEVDDKILLSPEDIADLLGMHVESVRRWCRVGRIDCYNFGGKYIIVGSSFKDFMRNSRRRPDDVL